MLASDPEAYDGKTIRVEAQGSVISSPPLGENFIIIGESGCEVPDAWASVRLDGWNIASPEINEFVNSPKIEIRSAKLVVEGQFDQWISPGCWSPRFGIKTAKVMLVSPIVSEPLPEMPERGLVDRIPPK